MMQESRLDLTLIPAVDDAPLHSREYQQELREFIESLQGRGFKVSVTIERIEAAAGGSPPTYLGDFAVIFKTGAGALVAVIVAWLHSRRGRKVRLKTADFDASAQTVEEVQQLVKLAAMKPRKKSAAPQKSLTKTPKKAATKARGRRT
ncbi:MAG: hypothetical protein ACLQVN_04985 [Bryobacteraceae bacterium]